MRHKRHSQSPSWPQAIHASASVEADAALLAADPKEAARTNQEDGNAMDPIALIKDGRIHYRNIPVNQTLEDWNDFWSEYKNA